MAVSLGTTEYSPGCYAWPPVVAFLAYQYVHACNACFHEVLTSGIGILNRVFISMGVACCNRAAAHDVTSFKNLLASTWQKIRVRVHLVMRFAMQK